jgi:hypothetical protein
LSNEALVALMSDDVNEPPDSTGEPETVYESEDYRPPADPDDRSPLDGDPHLPESGTRVAVSPGVATLLAELRRRLPFLDAGDDE